MFIHTAQGADEPRQPLLHKLGESCLCRRHRHRAQRLDIEPLLRRRLNIQPSSQPASEQAAAAAAAAAASSQQPAVWDTLLAADLRI
jgi:hypothetical protein